MFPNVKESWSFKTKTINTMQQDNTMQYNKYTKTLVVLQVYKQKVS